jgi:hypothetical protein
VVIRNALDGANRDDTIMRRRTVTSPILPPFSVRDWTRDNLDA